MGNFRFWRRIKILPWVRLNISKSGVSLSIGPRGFGITFGWRGVRATAGIPGTGLFFTHHTSREKIKEKLTAKDAGDEDGETDNKV